MGSYGWTNQLHMAQMHRWCDSMEFADALNNIATKDLSVSANCRSAVALLQSIHKSPPFHKTQRFPTEAAFVCVTHPSLAPLITRLIASLSRSDRTAELEREVKDNEVARRKFQGDRDQKLATTKTIDELRNLIIASNTPLAERHGAGVFVQDSFEKYYNLTWTKATA